MRDEARLCRIGPFGDFARAHQPVFVLLAFTDIARDTKDLDQLAAGALQREREHLGPEGRSVAAVILQITTELGKWRAARCGLGKLAEVADDLVRRRWREDLGQRLAHGDLGSEASQLLDRLADIGDLALR